MDTGSDDPARIGRGLDWRKTFANISGMTLPQKKLNADDANFDSEMEISEIEDLSKEKLLKYIEGQVIGRDAVFEGPFGLRKVLYCDYVASGKAMNCIEQFMLKHVLPMYANTHTTTTVTSSQTTSLRNEAKAIIREAVGANADDVVIFAGSGVTGAVHKLISVLDLRVPPVIFCGPFEHHSNLLPWREMDGHVVNISETEHGNLNLRHLEIALRTWCHSGRPLIGTFSAASNVTGVTTDTRKVAALLHKYGAVSLWDYATGGPYMDIQMHPEPLKGYDTSKDAIFISMHKFLGSPDSPGLLVASKDLFRNAVPSGCGGGTVLFVSENDHRYLKDIESREEGGTPAIIGSIRAGLAIKLKMAVGCDVIMERENELYTRAMDVWKDLPELEILGVNESTTNSPSTDHKLAVFSFLVRHPQTGYYLHHNYVAALLNDLFGIQSRGGCACAGVYAQHLLGIDRLAERRFGDALVEDPKRAKKRSMLETERTENEVLRPGFTRLNFAYFLSDEDADFIINAVAMVARHGWTLLPQYTYAARSGEWKHGESFEELNKKRLEDVTFDEQGFHFLFNSKRHNAVSGLPTSRIDCLKKAERIFFNANKITGKALEDKRADFASPKTRNLRWFILPCEAQMVLMGKKVDKKTKMILEVRRKIREMTEDEMKRDVIDDKELIENLPRKPEIVKEEDDIRNNNKFVQNGTLHQTGKAFNGDIITPIQPIDVKTDKKKKGALGKFFKAIACSNDKSVTVMER